jgi:cell division protein ZapB
MAGPGNGLGVTGFSIKRNIPAGVSHPSTGNGADELTSADAANYSQKMSESGDKSFGQELERLEKRLDDLVSICTELKEENRSLRQRQDALTAERATLLQKNEQVRARVEAMITRLKGMEHGV